MKIIQHIKVAVDAVVFGYTNGKLQLLLIQRKFGNEKDQWALPGGFVKDNESLDQAVVRELQEETAVQANYLEQLYTFGAVERDPRARIISVAYLALINPKNYKLEAATDAKDARWHELEDIPKLSFDHQEILEMGLRKLRSKISNQSIGFDLFNK